MPAPWGGSARQWATNIRLQPLGEKIKYPLTGRAVAQILMHYQPYQDTEKSRPPALAVGNNAIRKRRLADADPARRGSGSTGRGRYRSASRTPRAENGVSLQGPANERGGAIETNQRVAGQIVEGRGQALARQVGGGGM